MMKITRSRDRLIFNLWIPIMVRLHLYIETAPGISVTLLSIVHLCVVLLMLADFHLNWLTHSLWYHFFRFHFVINYTNASQLWIKIVVEILLTNIICTTVIIFGHCFYALNNHFPLNYFYTFSSPNLNAIRFCMNLCFYSLVRLYWVDLS